MQQVDLAQEIEIQVDEMNDDKEDEYDAEEHVVLELLVVHCSELHCVELLRLMSFRIDVMLTYKKECRSKLMEYCERGRLLWHR